MGRVARIAATVALAVIFVYLCLKQAQKTPVMTDEPLWLMRSLDPPSDLSDKRHHFWAIDVPGFNRWAYWAVLKTTGLDRIPPGEEPAWKIIDGTLYLRGDPKRWGGNMDARALDDMMSFQGEYAPRKAIMAMRMTDIAALGLCLVGLYWAALMTLKSHWLALVAVLPVVLSPVIATDVSIVSWSGDPFLIAALAFVLAAWLWFHLKGSGASRASVVIVGLLCGVATGCKHSGLLALCAFMTYLVIESRGWDRALNPIAAATVAFAAFAVVNPVVFFQRGELPWQVLAEMIRERSIQAKALVNRSGPLSFDKMMQDLIFWWPILPAGAYMMWNCRRERWFAPAALWSVFLVGGIIVGAIDTRFAIPRYFAPAEIGFFFPVSLAMLAGARALRAAPREKPGGTASTPSDPR